MPRIWEQPASGYSAKHAGINSVWLKNEKTRAAIDEVIWWHNATADVDGEPIEVTMRDVFSASRVKAIVAARHDVMRRLRYSLAWPVVKIGVLLERDHTTVLAGIRRGKRRGAPAHTSSASQYYSWLEAKWLKARRMHETRAANVHEYEVELSEIKRREEAERERRVEKKQIERELAKARHDMKVAAQRIAMLSGASDAAE
jgi:hypothetical protein